ncbi:MAG: flagellar filament capping protein FliD [Telluria sp.]
MATSIGPTYDPASTAAALAEKYTAPRQQILTAQTTQAGAAGKALTTLNSAILSYQSSLAALTGLNKTMMSQAATFSDTTIGSASAKPTATPGSYSFFVEQLATAHQVSYADLPEDTVVANAGNMDVKVGLNTFNVNLEAAGVDADNDTFVSVRELAAAINRATGNAGQVSASVVTIAGKAQLVLTAANTGEKNTISLDPTNLGAGTLKDALTPTAPATQPAGYAEIVKAQDAVVWLGAKGTGTAIKQASNTFSNIADVTMTFTRAQAAGENPFTLTVAADTGATNANVQSFVEAYNKLKGVIDGLVASGDPAKGVAAGAFANDSGVKTLQSRLVSMLRQAGTTSLAGFGITATRQGTLTVDTKRLTSQLAADPTGLDKLIGKSTATVSTGIAGSLTTYLKQWSSTVDGQIKQRKDATDRLQLNLGKRQDALDDQYNRAYQRYLLQFTKLQNMQSQMSSNTSLFDALFGNKSD